VGCQTPDGSLLSFTIDGIPTSVAELRATLKADLARSHSGFERLTPFIFRVGQYATASRSPLARLLRPIWLVADRGYLRGIVGVELPPTFRCGPGLALPHAGRGVVIHPNASVGANSMIFHRVTLGTHGSQDAPQLGNDVLVGAGACVIGAITVGEHVQIGANAVVTRDVPSYTSVAGVPARVVGERPKPA